MGANIRDGFPGSLEALQVPHKSGQVMERVCGDQRVGTVQATQEFLTQPKLLILIPAKAVRDISHRFRKQDYSAKHGQI